jgi:hypothetical protein
MDALKPCQRQELEQIFPEDEGLRLTPARPFLKRRQALRFISRVQKNGKAPNQPFRTRTILGAASRGAAQLGKAITQNV